ncbi:MAG TPA: hypothetical protein VGH40_18920 [Roseiarcus sp.]|jgi:hypothetical protein
MKRPPPHFVVEVRRQRRSTNGQAKSWLDDPRFAAAAAEAIAAPLVLELEPKLETKPAAPPPPPVRPAGRILPSLAQIEPVETIELAEPARRRQRKLEPAPPPVKLEALRPDPEPEPVALVAAPRQKIPARRRPATVEKAPEVAPQPAPPREGAIIRALADALAARAVSEKRPDPVAEASQVERREARQARHRRILDRYVRGVEPKPGKRWKSRLNKREK